MTGALRIGLDIGGTAIKAGAVQDGRLLRSGSAPTPHDFQACVAVLVEIVGQVAAGAGYRSVGVGVPGVVDHARGLVVDAPNLPFLEGQPLVRSLQQRLSVPVLIENDATAAALGEARCGAGRVHPNFLLATIGTGIGGGLVLDGRLWRGPGGMAGEFGHLTVGHDRSCGCGARGCLEAAVSATALVRWAREEGLDVESLPELADRARRNQPAALHLFRRAGAHLGEALAQVALLLDLRVFLIAGGGAPILDLLHDAALQSLARRAFGRSAGDFQILPGALGNNAGVCGAAELDS